MKIEHVAPSAIEARSFEIIDRELAALGVTLPDDKAYIIKRAIHTTADFDYARTLVFSADAPRRFAELVRLGGCVVTDTNMALAGVNKSELAKYGASARCFMAEESVATEARVRDVTRAVVSMERAAALDRPVIFVVGNAPTALIRLRQLYDLGEFTPQFIVGAPVGFVNVESAKEAIVATEIPHIVNLGRKGGSNVAAAICNALLYAMRDGIL